MSFTPDELQSFHTILEQKLGQQRRELERSFDQRMHVFKREMDQRLAFTQQELVRTFLLHLADQYRKLKEVINQRTESQQVHGGMGEPNGTGIKQQLEDIVERALDTQLISFDQLLNERFAPASDGSTYSVDTSSEFDEIEVQTEIPWDDLTNAVSNALDARLASLDESFSASFKNIEQFLSVRLQSLREELLHEQHDMHMHEERAVQPFDGTITNMQDMFTSIERLETIIESMQVAMTSNHTLLANRLYHHQQLPLERAHGSGGRGAITQNTNIVKNQLPLAKEK